MALKRYDAVVNGVQTILVLSDADAKALGDSVTEHKKAAAPAANKARKPANKSATASKKAAAPAATEPAGASEPDVGTAPSSAE